MNLTLPLDKVSCGKPTTRVRRRKFFNTCFLFSTRRMKERGSEGAVCRDNSWDSSLLPHEAVAGLAAQTRFHSGDFGCVRWLMRTATPVADGCPPLPFSLVGLRPMVSTNTLGGDNCDWSEPGDLDPVIARLEGVGDALSS